MEAVRNDPHGRSANNKEESMHVENCVDSLERSAVTRAKRSRVCMTWHDASDTIA